MVEVYANPELSPMFNLWQEKTDLSAMNPGTRSVDITFSDAQYYRFIEALDEGNNWSTYNMWSTLDEYYEDSPEYNWWKYGRGSNARVPVNPYMTITGLGTEFGKRENVQERLVARLKGDRDWSEPLFEVEIVEPYETILDVSQMSPEKRLRYEERIRDTPDTLRENGEPVLPIYTQGNYVTLVSLGNEDVGEAWFNSIYFTLQPGKAWPERKLMVRTINHPGGIK